MRESLVRIATGVTYRTGEHAASGDIDSGTRSVADALASLLAPPPAAAGKGPVDESGVFAEWPEARGRVLIKPNWVHHGDNDARRWRALVTQTELLDALLDLLAPCRPEEVIIADAPLQGCDWARLMERAEIDALVARHARRFQRLEVRDLRVVVRRGEALRARQSSSGRSRGRDRIVNLGANSALDEVSSPSGRFRVTMYDPREMTLRHRPGHHEYCVAEEVLDANLVINVPKLKTHCKTGITAALKNVVGISCRKSYLPHHRTGGSKGGGDCYAGKSVLKECAEWCLDRANESRGPRRAGMFASAAVVILRAARLLGRDGQLEGAWLGNDTVWRTVLDLQRILECSDGSGQICESRQRRVVNICDGVVAGEGDGPLRSTPIDLGVITLSPSAKAADWVHSCLMGVEPNRIPLVREAFRRGQYLTGPPSPDDIEVEVDGRKTGMETVSRIAPRPFAMPKGW